VEADRCAIARARRDVRNGSYRRATAQVVKAQPELGPVQFCARGTLHRDDGPIQTFHIVDENEAFATKGSVPYASPLARAVLGRAVGGAVTLGKAELGVIAVD
jgi:transcription elongation GreA/GreB family factor